MTEKTHIEFKKIEIEVDKIKIDIEEELYSVQIGDVDDIFKVLWLTGISVSVLCVLLQVILFIILPSSRKFDEKVLLQLTVARIVNTICEFFIMYVDMNGIVMDIVFAVYFQADFSLICWMFVFTKNLYDKVVLVFAFQKCNLIVASAIIWIMTLALGLVAPLLLKLDTTIYFDTFYRAYAHIKFFVVIINALIFVEIFRVAFRRDSNRNMADFLKTAVVSFILVCITSLQVFVTDVISYFIGKNDIVIKTFCIVNSFQVVAMMVIFIILAKGKITETVARKLICVRLRELNV